MALIIVNKHLLRMPSCCWGPNGEGPLPSACSTVGNMAFAGE